MHAKAETTDLAHRAEAGGEDGSRLQRLLKHRLVPKIAMALWLGILALAVWALHRQWQDLQFADFIAALQRIGPSHIALALMCTTLSYLCNSSLDLWAMRHQRNEKVPWPVVLRTAFVAMTFSMNAGGAILSGGSVRLRTYPRFGVKPLEIGALMIFISVVAQAGYFMNAGLHLTLSPVPLPKAPDWVSAGWAGPAFLLTSAAIILLFLALQSGRLTRWLPEKWRPDSTKKRVLAMIPAGALASGCDYLFAGLALRALFPELHGIHLSTFLAVFAVSQALAAISHVPAGAGVLELLLTALLSGTAETAALASSLIAFRVIHYMLPFALAAIILAGWEIWMRKQALTDKQTSP